MQDFAKVKHGDRKSEAWRPLRSPCSVTWLSCY